MSSPVRRHIVIPPHPGWPVEIEFSSDGPARARLADGRELAFALESDLLSSYGWTWDDVRRWAEQGPGDGDEPLAWAGDR